MSALLEIKGITKRFGGLMALQDINLSVKQGELRGIIGPNGSGKSTLFNLIVGRFKPTRGDILYQGGSIVGLRADERARRGIIIKFQITNVFEGLTVLDNILLGLTAGGRTDKKMRQSRLREEARQILQRVALADRLDEKAGILSHGQKQWLEIGMALAAGPSLLLLDEPTSGMGAEETKMTAEIVNQLKGEITTLIIEHDMDFVRSVSESITVLNMGRFLTEGSYEQIKTDEQVIQAYLGKGRK